jgi:hypothetical protein
MQVKLVIKNQDGTAIQSSDVNVTVDQNSTVADVKSQINQTLSSGFIELTFSMDGNLFQDQDLIGSHQALKYCIKY